MDLDFNKLNIFYEVVRNGGLSKAQDTLGVKVATISSQLISLEKALGTILLTRNKGGIKLSEEGEVLFNYLKENLPNINIIYDMIGNNFKEAKGMLKVSTWMGLGMQLLTSCLDEFQRKNPNLRLVIIGNNADMDFNNNDYDVAIREQIPNRDDLIHEKFFTVSHRLYATKEYIAQHGLPKKVEDLDHHILLSNTFQPYGRFELVDWHLSAGRKEGDLRKPAFVINSTGGIEKMINQHLGIGTLSIFYDSIKNSNLVEILPDYNCPSITFYYIYPKYMAKYEKLRVFRDYLFNNLKQKYSLA